MLPENNVVIKNILLNLIVTFLVIVLTLGFVIEEQSNYIYIWNDGDTSMHFISECFVICTN